MIFRKKNIRFSFLVLTWNRKAFLDKCISGLEKSIYNREQSEIIVLDNGSTDGTDQMIAKYESIEYIRIASNKGINSYKRLYNRASGDYLIVVDDDVIEFPDRVDEIFKTYMDNFYAFGYLAMNVVQDEKTDGSKPDHRFYRDYQLNQLTLEVGPTGGWLSCMRRRDFNKIKIRFVLKNLSMKNGDDGTLVHLLSKYCRLKAGIIKDHVCLHASGPYYAKLYGHTDREIEKYKMSGLHDSAKLYESEDPR